MQNACNTTALPHCSLLDSTHPATLLFCPIHSVFHFQLTSHYKTPLTTPQETKFSICWNVWKPPPSHSANSQKLKSYTMKFHLFHQPRLITVEFWRIKGWEQNTENTTALCQKARQNTEFGNKVSSSGVTHARLPLRNSSRDLVSCTYNSNILTVQNSLVNSTLNDGLFGELQFVS